MYVMLVWFLSCKHRQSHSQIHHARIKRSQAKLASFLAFAQLPIACSIPAYPYCKWREARQRPGKEAKAKLHVPLDSFPVFITTVVCMKPGTKEASFLNKILLWRWREDFLVWCLDESPSLSGNTAGHRPTEQCTGGKQTKMLSMNATLVNTATPVLITLEHSP